MSASVVETRGTGSEDDPYIVTRTSDCCVTFPCPCGATHTHGVDGFGRDPSRTTHRVAHCRLNCEDEEGRCPGDWPACPCGKQPVKTWARLAAHPVHGPHLAAARSHFEHGYWISLDPEEVAA